MALLRSLAFLLILASSVHGQPPPAVFCDHPYALCAYANCTFNDDLTTASCGCYALNGVSAARVGLIPDEEAKEEAVQVCNTTTSCGAPDQVNVAPVCAGIRPGGDVWPTADRVSTFSMALAEENGANNASWSCPAAPGRKIPVCMLAPCVYSQVATTNPYNYGEHNMTCTCPLIDISAIAYNVSGGLQDPCSMEESVAGAYVQAAGGEVLASFESNPTPAWEAVEAAFEGDDDPNNNDGTATPNGGATPAPAPAGDTTTTLSPTAASSEGCRFSMMSVAAVTVLCWSLSLFPM